MTATAFGHLCHLLLCFEATPTQEQEMEKLLFHGEPNMCFPLSLLVTLHLTPRCMLAACWPHSPSPSPYKRGFPPFPLQRMGPASENPNLEKIVYIVPQQDIYPTCNANIAQIILFMALAIETLQKYPILILCRSLHTKITRAASDLYLTAVISKLHFYVRLNS